MSGEVRTLRKFAVTVAWLTVSGSPSLVLLALGWQLIGGRGDQTTAFLLWLWLLSGIVTAPVYRRMLAAVPDVKALPPDGRRLDHLPASCARLAREAAAILAQIDALGLDAALQRAWELANEIDRADPTARAELERAGASLEVVRELVATRAAGSPVDAEQQRARLIAALARFEGSLGSPAARAFR